MTDQFKDRGGPIYGGLSIVTNNSGRPLYMLTKEQADYLDIPEDQRVYIDPDQLDDDQEDQP